LGLIGANKPQTAAITHGEGACLVLAGPGSGKTFTLTKRILYLLEQKVPPEMILVITFTKEAALSMQSRFREMSGGDGVHKVSYPVNFGTFHSVFYHILRESNVLGADNLLQNSEKKELLLSVLHTFEKEQGGRQAGQESYGSLGEDALKLLSAISYYKNTMQLPAARSQAPARWQACFELVFGEYEKAVRRTRRLDFDDMLYRCMELLKENVQIRQYWQKRFRHILIDEFQDINPVQYEIVKLLADKPCNLFAVGDDDQSIYGFRGSEPDCMKRFKEEFQARQLLLDVNYRSRPEIVEASLAVIGENKNRFVKKLHAAGEESAEGGGEVVSVHAFPDREDQYGYLLQTFMGQRGEAGSRAVLFRTNSYMQSFAARLKAADIPYEMREKAVSIYEHFIVTDVMCYLQIAHGVGGREQVLRVMNRPSRYISREAVGEGRADIGQIMAYYEKSSLPPRQKSSMKSQLEQLDRQLACLRSLPLRPAVQYIGKAIGYERHLRDMAGGNSEKWQEWQEILEWLKEDAGKHKGLKEWMTFQEEYSRGMEQKEGIGERKAGAASAGEGEELPLQLLTVHGAKGLEFDRVWIPDCNEKVFPHGRMPDEKTVEEERRIFYVAMTRAKNSLELMYLTGTKDRPRLPSRFLNPLYSSSSSSSSSSSNSSSYSQLSRNSSKASTTFSYSSSSSI